MRCWLRQVMVALVLTTVFVGGGGGAWAGKASHDCDSAAMSMSMDDCLGSHDGIALPDCSMSVCGLAQMILPSRDSFGSGIILVSVETLFPCNDFRTGGLRGSPDLRPPIA